jgi:hypothetical protein
LDFLILIHRAGIVTAKARRQVPSQQTIAAIKGESSFSPFVFSISPIQK